MRASFALVVMSMAASVLTTRPAEPQSVQSVHVAPSKASAIFVQLTNSVKAHGQRSGMTKPVIFIFFMAIPLILVMVLATFIMSDGEDDQADLKSAQRPLMSPGQAGMAKQAMSPGYGVQRGASPAQRQAPVHTSPGTPIFSSAVGSAVPAGAFASPQPGSRLQSPQVPQTMPAGAGLLSSIWSGSAARSMPPPLCQHTLGQGQSVFKIPKGAFGMLAARRPIEVLGAFDYPVAYARIGAGAEGSRLEVVTEPSWGNIEVTVGPLDWPGVLGSDAAIHGPNRELYGPFGRSHTGFAVGHYSQAGSVLNITPRKMATGIFVELSSASGQQVATVTDVGNAFQVQMSSGVDGFLVLSSVLATFIAEQSLIDEFQATV